MEKELKEIEKLVEDFAKSDEVNILQKYEQMKILIQSIGDVLWKK